MISKGRTISVNIKGKTTSFVLTLAIVLSSGQALSVQAAIAEPQTTSDSAATQSSNSGPNPGTPENKPNALNVISKYTTKNINNIANGPANITSTIGWKKENGYWYYYRSDNTRATGWIKPDSNWYYLNYDGKMATGWIYSSGTWYYLDKSGSMSTGWKLLNNTWYFLNESGGMVTGLNVIDNNTYMLYSSGAMAKGWVKLNNYWYYFNNNGSMSTGWVNSGSDYYYLDPSTGRLLKDTIAGGYKIGSDGKRLEAVTSSNNSNSSPASSGIYKGIDISHYNGDINFTKVKSAGIQCVYIKATEGTTYVDNYLETYYNGAKSAGLKTGFYHFLVGTSAPETQAQNFYNHIKDKQSDLKPVLDIETYGFDTMDYTIRFINEFKRLSNMDLCIYTYSDFINSLDTRLAPYSLWEANYSKRLYNLPSNNIWSSRVGCQYTDQGSIDGINGDVDLNEFTQDIFR
ncbi:glycoside hydrolase [Clostridium saccharobutylicum]|nr:glycoside hydrolase [Clostridium saccharobutylicum]